MILILGGLLLAVLLIQRYLGVPYDLKAVEKAFLWGIVGAVANEFALVVAYAFAGVSVDGSLLRCASILIIVQIFTSINTIKKAHQ